MNKYIKQFYNEGLATTFYLKPLAFIKRHIKSKTAIKVLDIILKIIYTVAVLLFAAIIFRLRFPFL